MAITNIEDDILQLIKRYGMYVVQDELEQIIWEFEKGVRS